MPMDETLKLVRYTLENGMDREEGSDSLPRWYIKTWEENDPLEINLSDFPLAVIKPNDTTRLDQYVQEDTELDPLVVYLFPTPIRDPRGTAVRDINATVVAMTERVIALLRADPTLTAAINALDDVESYSVIDAKVTGTRYRQPGFSDTGSTIHSGEVNIQVKRRASWALD